MAINERKSFTIFLSISLLSLSGCSSIIGQIPVLRLFDEGPKPPQLALRVENITSMPKYIPMRSCDYISRMSEGFVTQNDKLSLTLKKVRDRLLVTANVDNGTSTALISESGQIFDFNTTDENGSRFTPEEYTKDGKSNQVNNISLFVPTFYPKEVVPEQIVSILSNNAGVAQVAFIYKGLADFREREVILLDLVMVYDGHQAGHRIGFSIVDRSNGLPLLLEANGKPAIRLEQLSCSR